MGEETTQDMSNGRSFEARVFARFDSLDQRIGALETHSERRSLETKPIWERALAEIGEVRAEVSSGLGEVRSGFGEVRSGFGEVRSGLGEVRSGLGEVRSGLGEVRSGLAEVRSELAEVRSELAEVRSELAEVRSELAEVKTGLTEVRERVGGLEDSTRLMARKLDIFNRDLTTLRAEQLGLEDRVEKLEPRTLP